MIAIHVTRIAIYAARLCKNHGEGCALLSVQECMVSAKVSGDMGNNLCMGSMQVASEGSSQPDIVTTAKIHMVELMGKKKRIQRNID